MSAYWISEELARDDEFLDKARQAAANAAVRPETRSAAQRLVDALEEKRLTLASTDARSGEPASVDGAVGPTAAGTHAAASQAYGSAAPTTKEGPGAHNTGTLDD